MSDNLCDSKVDEDTYKINKLSDRVYKYDSLPDAAKVKSVKEYQDIAAQIKLYDDVIKGYTQALVNTDKDPVKSKKSVTEKTYSANLKRFDQLKDIINNPEGLAVSSLLDMLTEIKQIKANISKYLDKELDTVNL